MKKTIPHSPEHPGFALVVTLALMILLTIIAVGLLSLSAISLRSSAQGTALSEARANARMALMLAIGELQKQTGPDTRVTASSSIVDPNSPPLIGVWKSWEGSDHDSQGRPIMPDYGSKKKSDANGGRFLTWLVSGAEQGSAPSNPGSLVSKSPSSGTVPLLAGGSLQSSDSRQIHVVPTTSKNGGRFAWWVSPENQKARLAQPHKPRTNDVAGWMEMGQSHLVPNPGIFGLEALLDDPEDYKPDPNSSKPASRAITLATTELIASGNTAEPQHSFHDLSTSAVGLLTNTATGGWRKDLSLLTEKWDSIYSGYSGGKLPLFRFSPNVGATYKVPKPTTTAYEPKQSNLYPWSEYSLILGYKQPATYHAASASWASLQSFATSYKNFSYNSGVVKSPFVWDKIAKQKESLVTPSEFYNHKHKQRLYPQIARFRFLVYAKAFEDPQNMNKDPKRYRINIKYVPVFTLWNPYNVTLEHTISGTLNAGQGTNQERNFLGFGWRRSPPGAMAVVNPAGTTIYNDPDDVPLNLYKLFTPGNFQTLDSPNNNVNPYDTQLQANIDTYNPGATNMNRWIDKRTFGCWLPEGTLTFKPGEAKIFSPEWSDPGYGISGVLRLKEGYDPTNVVGVDFWDGVDPTGKGMIYPSGTPGNVLIGNNSVWFLLRTDRVTQPYKDREPGSGFSLSFGDGSSHFGGTSTMPSGIGDEFHNITSLSAKSEGDAYWPPDEVDEVGYTVADLASGPWKPLFSISFGPRITLGTAPGTNQNRPTKGVVQNNALASMVLSDPKKNPSERKGKDHPVNNTFDFAYHSLPFGSTITPNLSASEGYIATGYQSGDGLSRLIMDEIPLRPMASLVELQGWNPRGNNPYPPFQMNLIGNSDATPLIPNDNIVPPVLAPSGVAYNLQHDDAYCANHLLFDDWFVSSIAPQPKVLGGNIAKNIETSYQDFLTGTDKLSNRSYQSIPEDTNLTPSLVTARVQQIINSSDGWLKISSRLEVDGMFNVNSTSVDAWKAILGHAKSREEIALYGKNGIQSVTPAEDHPVTRGAAASDVEAGSGPAIGGGPTNAAEYAGFRSLTDDQIGDLAEKIVAQVRKRGPFLSLAEFVNRQLSTDNDLALAGAVQTAINNLSDDPMKILRDPANSLSDTTMTKLNPDWNKKYKDMVADADYKFAEAAEGSSAFGSPGWIRQADILRPIAPIISARDDTFTIRAYGDARDANGNVAARAWCEAVVQRTRNFCGDSDPSDSIEPPSSPINTTFGRKYQIVAFRWLNPNEV